MFTLFLVHLEKLTASEIFKPLEYEELVVSHFPRVCPVFESTAQAAALLWGCGRVSALGGLHSPGSKCQQWTLLHVLTQTEVKLNLFQLILHEQTWLCWDRGFLIREGEIYVNLKPCFNFSLNVDNVQLKSLRTNLAAINLRVICLGAVAQIQTCPSLLEQLRLPDLLSLAEMPLCVAIALMMERAWEFPLPCFYREH